MNDTLRMQISAYIDGELPASEAELLSRRLSQDVALREQAARYLEIGRLLRGERSVPRADELRARIATAVADEAAGPGVAEGVAGRRWLRPVAGLAVAASVAVLALVGLQRVETTPDVGTIPAQAAVAVDSAPYTEPAFGDVAGDRPGERLMQYYLSHGATSGDLGANGILSRLVTLELRGGELVDTAAGELPLESTGPDEDNDASEAARDE